MNTSGLWQYDELANIFISPDNRLYGIDDLLDFLNLPYKGRLTRNEADPPLAAASADDSQNWRAAYLNR